MNTSFDILCRDLRALGLCEGDTVIVHSSLSSMGHVEGGAETVIAALRAVLGESGTLLFPAFSYATAYKSSEFSLNDTPVCVGKIPDTFRQMPGVLRSLHPTHSVCAIGAHAAEMVADHALDDTPMGPHSPYRKLPAADGKILMLGCSLRSNSFIHAMEEVAEVSYVLTGHHYFQITDGDGNVITKGIRRHYFNRPGGHVVQRYDRTLDVLDASAGDFTEGEVHGAHCVLMRSAALQEKAVAKMKEDETFFVDDPDGLIAAEKAKT